MRKRSRRIPTLDRASPLWAPLALGALLGLLCFFLMHDLGLLWLIPMGRLDWLWPALLPVAGAGLAATRARNLVPGSVLLLALLWTVVVVTPLSRAMIQPLRRADVPAPSDAVVVLSSVVRPSGTLTTAAAIRLYSGIELVRQGYAPRLVLTELPDPNGSYSAAARERLSALELDIPVVTAAGRVRNTHDEALAISRLARERGWQRVLLVSSPLHLRRAAATFEKAGLTVLACPALSPHYDVDNPVGRSARLWAFRDGLHEWPGLWVYRWRGWL